jgi:hypothetical protein
MPGSAAAAVVLKNNSALPAFVMIVMLIVFGFQGIACGRSRSTGSSRLTCILLSV